ncbi:hypothetical protein D9613_006845 [Agrocybe pediades]|uniref:Xylanolytic transcriptional activator regulatory domain-containing protein n=1 Tax=Agrocybe pediades TaxID=84607 RepID=A0A8H4QIK5_9AGAR|nr:hypothetical protein D9613_006845 [Agrocybe pediades]
MQSSDSNAAFIKAPKRKRLAKVFFPLVPLPHSSYISSKRPAMHATGANVAATAQRPKLPAAIDASGRAVPAPRPFKPERLDPQSSSSSDAHPHSQSHYGASSNQFRIYPHQATSQSHQFQNDNSDDDNKHNRKRVRHERGGLMPVDELVIEGPITSVVRDRAAPDLDPSLTRELTNLFFAHCNPARTVIHKPTFSSSLSHNRVPSHLLLAVCALAAPLSKQPRIRTAPARFAGRPFAQEALSQMFDGAGRLVVEPNLATAQALCILQMHDILTKERNALWSSRFHGKVLFSLVASSHLGFC